MLSRLAVALCVLVAPATAVRPFAVASPSPITVAGGRSVEVRDDRGTITRITTIPVRSQFATYGGVRQPCTFTASASGVASDGQRYVAGQLVRSQRWLFVEGEVLSLGEPTPAPATRGALAAAVRHFVVFCDSTADAIGTVDVPSTDTVLDPRWTLGQMLNQLRLVPAAVAANPVVTATGGYVTRYPVWLGIQPQGWAWQRSADARWRGWLLSLSAQPTALAFNVRFTPSAPAGSVGAGSVPFAATVTCVDVGATAVVGAVSVPPMPQLPHVSTPGVNGPCRYTPPGPGTLAVQALVTFRVTFWANGYREPAPDYVLRGPTAIYRVGELSSVNRGG
jgi:hypothetical protein